MAINFLLKWLSLQLLLVVIDFWITFKYSICFSGNIVIQIRNNQNLTPSIHTKSCLQIACQSTSIKYETLFTQTSIYFISCLKKALSSNKLDHNIKESHCNDSKTLSRYIWVLHTLNETQKLFYILLLTIVSSSK